MSDVMDRMNKWVWGGPVVRECVARELWYGGDGGGGARETCIICVAGRVWCLPARLCLAGVCVLPISLCVCVLLCVSRLCVVASE